MHILSRQSCDFAVQNLIRANSISFEVLTLSWHKLAKFIYCIQECVCKLKIVDLFLSCVLLFPKGRKFREDNKVEIPFAISCPTFHPHLCLSFKNTMISTREIDTDTPHDLNLVFPKEWKENKGQDRKNLFWK